MIIRNLLSQFESYDVILACAELIHRSRISLDQLIRNGMYILFPYYKEI